MHYSIEKTLPNAGFRATTKIERLSLGVSLDNPKYSDDHLSAILKWCQANSVVCLIFIGDHLYQYTFRLLKKDDVSAARAEADRLGTLFKSRISRFISSRRLENEFLIVRLSELAGDEKFELTRKAFYEIVERGGELKESISETAKNYIERKKRKMVLAVDDERAIQLSTSYLIDELVFYQLLCEQGWLVEAYPGSEMPVLADILRGRLPEAPEILRKRIFHQIKAREGDQES